MSKLAKLQKLGKVPPKKTSYKVVGSSDKKKKKPSPASSGYTGVKTSSKTKTITTTNTGKSKKTTSESWRSSKENIPKESIPEGMVYFEPTGTYVHEQNLKEAVLQYMSMRKYHTDFSRLPEGKKEAIMKLYEKSAYKKAMEKDIEDRIVTAQEWTARRGIAGSTIALYSPYSPAQETQLKKAKAQTILESHLQAMGITGGKKSLTVSGSQASLKGKNIPKDEKTLQAYKEPTLLQPLEDIGEKIYEATRGKGSIISGIGKAISGPLMYPSYAERQMKAMARRFEEVDKTSGFSIPQFTYMIGEEGGEFLTQTALMTVGGAAGPAALSLSLATTEFVKDPEAALKDPLEFATKYVVLYGIGKAGEIAGGKVSERLKVTKGKVEAKMKEGLKQTYTIGELDIGYGKIVGHGKSITEGKIGPLKLEVERPYAVEYATPIKVVEEKTTLQTTGMLDIGKGKVSVDILGRKIKIAETEPAKAYLDITKEGKAITTLATELKTGKRVGAISQAVVKSKPISQFEDIAIEGKEFHAMTTGRRGYIGSVGIGEGKELTMSMVRFQEYQKLIPKEINLKEKTGIEMLWSKEEPLETMKEGKVKTPSTRKPTLIEKLKIGKRKLSDILQKKAEYYEYKAAAKGRYLLQKAKAQEFPQELPELKEIESVFAGERIIGKMEVKLKTKTMSIPKTLAISKALAIPKTATKTKQQQKVKEELSLSLPKMKLYDVVGERPMQKVKQSLLTKTPTRPREPSVLEMEEITPALTTAAPPAFFREPSSEIPILPEVPSFIPPLNLSFKGIKPEKRGGLKVKARYKPSLDAVLLGITGKKPAHLTGLETRPILRRKKKRLRL